MCARFFTWVHGVRKRSHGNVWGMSAPSVRHNRTTRRSPQMYGGLDFLRRARRAALSDITAHAREEPPRRPRPRSRRSASSIPAGGRSPGMNKGSNPVEGLSHYLPIPFDSRPSTRAPDPKPRSDPGCVGHARDSRARVYARGQKRWLSGA